MTKVFIVSGTTTVIPADWNSASNTVDVIGAGGGGSYGAGAGGGEHRANTNQSYTAGATRTVQIGAGGPGATTNGNAGTAGTFSQILQDDNATVAVKANGGSAPAYGATTGAAGGTGGTGTTNHNGGTGGASNGAGGGGGGGGAGGPTGVGATGGAASFAGNSGGGGGGGANSGTAGANVTTLNGTGGLGGNGKGGSGGGAGGASGNPPVVGTVGTATTGGGGGGGGNSTSNPVANAKGGNGATDTEFDATHGAGGGGGGGGGNGGVTGGSGGGGNGGLYGGGGGSGGNFSTGTVAGGNGANGIIVLTYTPAAGAPFVQADLGPTHDVRWMLPRDLSRGLNPNLQKNPVPFNQADWSDPFRAPHLTPDASRSLNPNLQKNNAPVLNATGIKAVDLLGPPTPPQSYNSALYAAASCGLVGVDSEGTALVGGSSVNTIDYTGVTVGSGANRALVAMMTTSQLTVGMTAVWDPGGANQTMTLIGTASSFNETNAIFGLRNPASGNNIIRFSWTTAGIPTVSAISLITVDQSSDANAFKNYQSLAGAATSSLSVTVPSKAGDLVVGVGGAPTVTVTAVGDNSIYLDNTSTGVHSAAGWNAGAASVTFTGTSSTSGDWVLGAIDVSAFPCAVSLPLLNVTGSAAGFPNALLPPSDPLNINLLSNNFPFNQVDWAKATRLPLSMAAPPLPLNINLFTNPIPVNQTDWAKPQQIRITQPQPQSGLNINLFTNPVPVANLAPSAPFAVPTRPAPEQAYNQNLYGVVTVALPLNQYDFAKPFFPRALALPGDPLNINLFTNPLPFNQTDWSRPANRFTQPFPQAGLNINLFANPVPVANLTPAAPFAVPAQPAREQAYNQNLYSAAVVAAAPFNQSDFARPLFPRGLVPSADQLNINLFTNAVPFNQADWSVSRRVVYETQVPDGLNLNLFTNPVPFGAADTGARRVAALTPPDQPYNVALYTVTVVAAQPFAQGDVPLVRRPLAAAALSDPLNINLFRNDVPIANADSSTPMRLRAAVDPGQPLNLNLFGIFVPPVQFDIVVTARPKLTTAPASAFNPNLQTNNMPFSQFDYPPAHRGPAAPIDLSRGQPNPNIFTNPMPFLQPAIGIPMVLRHAPMLDAVNVALLGTPAVAPTLPFNQYNFTPVVKPQPQRRHDLLNPTLLASFVPPPPDAEHHSKPFFATPGRLMNI